MRQITYGFILLLSTSLRLYSQEDISLNANEVDILYNYYKQDGEHAAVTGGEGSQELKNQAPIIIFKIPITKYGVLNVSGGIDTYTSASSGNIDKYTTGASNSTETALSAEDTRKHIDAGYTEELPNLNGAISFSVGYSSEYDVKSLNAGIGINKKTEDNNHSFSFDFKGYLDEWLLIYPGEIRNPRGKYHHDDDDDDDHHHDKKHKKKKKKVIKQEEFNKDMRYTYNLGFSYEAVINQRTNFALLLDFTYQEGLLETPFHRVYFNDGIRKIRKKKVRVEKLPDTRKKYAVGLRVNHFLTSNIITRFYYRFYTDDFGILSHTASVEVPFKVGQSFTLSPFLRYYQQTGSTYFAPFAEHLLSERYYTSDYDLSEFSSINKGIGVKYAPLGGVLYWNIGKNDSYLKMNFIQIRYSHYQRTDGLKANNITLGTKFTFN